MAKYGVTEKGFVKKNFDVILSEIQQEISDDLGFDVSQNPQSILNSCFLIPFSDKIATLWDVAQDAYYAKFVNTATGVSLDNACQFGSVFREGNRASEYQIHCTAYEGTVIKSGTLISSVSNPPIQLKCMADTEVLRTSCNAIAIKPVTVAAGTYTVTFEDTQYSYTATSSDTVKTIVEGLAAALASIDGYTATVVDDSFVLVEDSVLSRANSFALTANLTTEYVVALVYYSTVDYGEIVCPSGSITKVVSSVDGLLSVTNALDPVAGRLREEDWQLRQSFIGKSYSSATMMTEAIESYILENVKGIISARCEENEKDTTDSEGRPPHSIEVIAYGGSEADIAACILKKKAPGIQTYGQVSVNVVGKYGDQVVVNFNRPEMLYAWLKVEITADSGSVPGNYATLVRESIIDEAGELAIGEPLLSQRFIDNIYAVLPGTTFCKIKVASGSDETTEPSSYVEGNLEATNRQVILVAGGRIGVTVT